MGTRALPCRITQFLGFGHRFGFSINTDDCCTGTLEICQQLGQTSGIIALWKWSCVNPGRGRIVSMVCATCRLPQSFSRRPTMRSNSVWKRNWVVLFCSITCGYLPLLAQAAQSPPAEFGTVINVPPISIGNDGSIGSNTQLNLSDGGTIGTRFDAGAEGR